MIAEGQIVLFRFPQTNLEGGKLRPALVVRQVPGKHRDWLICMISSQLDQKIPDFDEVIGLPDPDFLQSGLKLTSLIRITRLAVTSEGIFLGRLGHITPDRLSTIKRKLAAWLLVV